MTYCSCLTKETDVAVAPLTITMERNEAVDFLNIYYYETIGIMIQQMSTENQIWQMFSLFAKQVWIAVFVTCCISTVFINIISRISPTPNDSGFKRLSNCVWYTVSCVTNQGQAGINYYGFSQSHFLSIKQRINFQEVNMNQKLGRYKTFLHFGGYSFSL